MIGDLDALARRLDVIVAGSDEAAAHAKEEKEQSRAASTARKEASRSRGRADRLGVDPVEDRG